MSIEKTPVWLVWEWRPEKIGNDTVWMACLRSVDREEWIANAHKKALDSENETFGREARVVIERVPTNHLFGHEDSKSIMEKQIGHLIKNRG